MIQEIRLSKGCPYNCSYCFNDPNFTALPYPKIESNKVTILDEAFLSNINILYLINKLGSEKINNKVVYYHILQGINILDLTQEIADALYKNRFKNIKIAWDKSYTKKNMYLVYDAVKMLKKAGYKKILCFILSNYSIPYEECKKKLDLLKIWGVRVCNCIYRNKYLKEKPTPYLWRIDTIKKFKRECRKHTQLVNFNIDPELK